MRTPSASFGSWRVTACEIVSQRSHKENTMANNAASAAPSGKVTKQAGNAVPQHKKMAMGEMPKVDGKKIPA
jgi:hypothetical protein